MSEGSPEEEKPWKKRLRELKEQHQQAQDGLKPKEQPGEGELPTELQQQLLGWYRNTFIVAGAALVGSMWQWTVGGRSKAVEVFLPPRAQSLPTDVVDGWKRSMRFKEGVRFVGRQTLLATGVAALYFGVELGSQLWREQEGWANTALAGAAAGGYLGTMLPGPSRARGAALGGALGGVLGAASGLAQQQLLIMAPDLSAEGQRRRRHQEVQGLQAGQQGSRGQADEPVPESSAS